MSDARRIWSVTLMLPAATIGSAQVVDTTLEGLDDLGTLSVIDATRNLPEESRPTAGHPDFLCINTMIDGKQPGALCGRRDGKKVCCANRLDNTVTVFEAGSDKTLATIPTGKRPIRIRCLSAQDGNGSK